MAKSVTRLGFIFLLISILALTLYILVQNTEAPVPEEEEIPKLSAQEICKENNGKWLAEFNECENIKEKVCSQAGGSYDECASACRHEVLPGPCIMQCVAVCKF